MKKLLLSTAAVAMGLAMAAPAHADGVTLDLGGHFKGYTVYADQDTSTAVAPASQDHRDFDILRETEIHFTGETTLDNGLTVGAHIEADVDGGDNFAVDESYAYFAGSWGRVNFGNEDGAAYLLQVAAPSADSNYDGIRQYVQPMNYGLTDFGVNAVANELNATGLDYDNDLTTGTDKLTYLSPVFSGFQAGASYTPDTDAGTYAALISGAGNASRGINGVNASDESTGAISEYGSAWEVAVRYEGQWDEVGFNVGAGYTEVELEGTTTTSQDDAEQWNVGLDVDWGAFGLGVIYTEGNNGHTTNDENETVVVGIDYTTGGYKLGASWLNNDTDVLGAGNSVETDRYTAGVVYTYGPGMTFRGSISQVDHDVQNASDIDGTSVLLGTQIDF